MTWRHNVSVIMRYKCDHAIQSIMDFAYDRGFAIGIQQQQKSIPIN